MQKFLLPSPIQPPIRDAIAKASEREEKGLPTIDFSSGNVGKLPFYQEFFTKMDIEVNENLPEGLRFVAEAVKLGIKDSFYPNPRALAYSPTGGTDRVKKQVINYFKEVHGVPLAENDTANVIATAGGQQAMAAALRAINADTNIFLSQWDYAAIPGIIKDINCNEVRVEVNDDLSINKADFEEKITDESVFYISMPNNPTGYVSPQELEFVVKLITDSGGGVIWDAPYIFTILKLTPTKAEFNKEFLREKIEDFKKISSKYYEDMCILSSISKTCLMAGIRFGFATASTHWISLMNAILGRENLSSPTASFITGNHALRMFLQNPISHEWVCNILAERLTLLIEEDLPLILPKNGVFGGLYALVKTNGVDGTKFANNFIDKYGIVTVTGNPFFGGPINAIRLSIVATPWTEGDKEWIKNVNALKKALM